MRSARFSRAENTDEDSAALNDGVHKVPMFVDFICQPVKLDSPMGEGGES